MWFDILAAVVGICCLWSGWRSGILVQLSGIIGVVLGTWVAYQFSEQIALWVGIDIAGVPYWLLFTVVLLAVLVAAVMLSHLVTHLFKAGGIALPLRILGAAFSLVKGALLLSLMLFLLEMLSAPTAREPKTLHEGAEPSKELLESAREARCYPFIKWVADFTFPYLTPAREFIDQVIDRVGEQGGKDEPTEEPDSLPRK